MQAYNPYLCLLLLHFLISNPLSARTGSHFSARCGRGCQQRHTPDAFLQSPILLSPLLYGSQPEFKVIPITNFCFYLVFPMHSVNAQCAKQCSHNRYRSERIWRQKDATKPCQPHLEYALRHHPCLRLAA